jgi:hypothetical protein
MIKAYNSNNHKKFERYLDRRARAVFNTFTLIGYLKYVQFSAGAKLQPVCKRLTEGDSTGTRITRTKPKIPLAIIFSISIMRALSQLGNSLAAFCSSFSDLSLARMQIAPVKKTHQEILGFPVSNDVLCAG